MSTKGIFDPSSDPVDPYSSDPEVDDEPYNGGPAVAVADDPGEWLGIAVDHMENGKVDRALECFANATKCSPDGASGLAKAFDTKFERYLHALLRTAVYGGQDLQDDLVDTCRNLCIDSGRWSLAALCLHILDEDEFSVLKYVELALVEAGELTVESDLPFAATFEDKYRDISDLVSLAAHYEVELDDASESDRILEIYHRIQLKGKKSVGSSSTAFSNFTAAKIAALTASAIEAKERATELQLQQEKEKAAKWKSQIEQICAAALEGRHSCNLPHLVDVEKLRSLGYALEGGWIDIERQSSLKIELSQRAQSCSDSYSVVMRQVEKLNCKLIVPKFADFCNDASQLMMKSEPHEEFLTKFTQWFSRTYDIQPTSKAVFSRDLTSLADQMERLLLLSERVDVVNQTNNSKNIWPKGEVAVSWKYAPGYTILSDPQSAQMMHWLSTEALTAMEHILYSVSDAANDARESVSFYFTSETGLWRATALSPSNDPNLFFCQYSVGSVDPFLVGKALHVLGYRTNIFVADADRYEVYLDPSSQEVTERAEIYSTDRGRLLRVLWGNCTTH